MKSFIDRIWPRAAFVALAMLMASCSGGFRFGANGADATPPWLRAVFPQSPPGEIRVDSYENNHVVLVRGGRAYGSTGDDMPGQVIGILGALALAPSGPSMLRVGQVGFGTGTSVAVSLAASSRMVEIFEEDEALVGAALRIADRTGLDFHEGLPRHPALRVLTLEQAEQEPFLRYDVMYCPPATSAIAGTEELLTVERLRNLGALLSGDGILVHHVPAYEMDPQTYRRFLRTFAHAFPQVLVLSAGPQGGDTFVVGATQPIRFRAENLTAMAASPSLRRYMEMASLRSPWEIAARVLFASREEVLTFAQTAPPITETTPLIHENEAPPRPELPPPDAPDADQQRWQEQMTAYRSHFEMMDVIRQQMLSLDWPHGHVCPAGLGSSSCLVVAPNDARGADVLGELALSLMAAGRFPQAPSLMSASMSMGAGQIGPLADRVFGLLLDEAPEPPEDFDLPEALAEAVAQARASQCEQASQAAQAAATTADTSTRLVAAFVLYRCAHEQVPEMDRVSRLMTPLARDNAIVTRYPIALFVAARAAMVLGDYAAATWQMADYVATTPHPQDVVPIEPPDETIIEPDS